MPCPACAPAPVSVWTSHKHNLITIMQLSLSCSNHSCVLHVYNTSTEPSDGGNRCRWIANAERNGDKDTLTSTQMTTIQKKTGRYAEKMDALKGTTFTNACVLPCNLCRTLNDPSSPDIRRCSLMLHILESVCCSPVQA